ncbi:hypothetical protein PCANC_01386 [Puccinia coronata f. sp. avenae]|uniref:Uncharacterized protein n=1 Tax=Puccinia coronata f. sp. avenae TaxID=200324 RepID=A0A2N5W688_9BASI|nr:hypothetical protein PCANC_01386 [Puccinia coronata f. sp. avenae]
MLYAYRNTFIYWHCTELFCRSEEVIAVSQIKIDVCTSLIGIQASTKCPQCHIQDLGMDIAYHRVSSNGRLMSARVING